MTKLKNIGFVFLLLFTIWGCSNSEFSAAGCEGSNKEECLVERQVFTFDVDEFSACSLACDGGVRTRTVRCLNADNEPVPDDQCSGVKPASREICNAQACTAEYTWNIGPYGTCSETCGGGTASRAVRCQSNNGTFVGDANCTEVKPQTTTSCNPEACPEVYNWVPGTPGACSQPCGGGTATRSVTCQDAQFNVVNSNLCTEARPDTTVSCNTQSCNFTYTWSPGSYGTCSETCGGGIQTRSLGCLRNDGMFVAHSFCPSDNTPDIARACNTNACPQACTKKQISEPIPEAAGELDILLVVDDSGSMYQDNARLAAKLSGFINQLESSNIDWQMCVTSTDVDYFKGRPIQWQGANSGHILKKSSGNLSNIFRDTIKWIGAGFSSDEQGIHAMNLSLLDNARSNCYRQNAGLSVIVISDEDERSVGGDITKNAQQFKPLGPLNTPNSFLNTVNQVFPVGKRFVVNSIVVKDNQCRLQQDAQGELSFYGTKYKELSNLTGGVIESICAPDFAVSLRNIHSACIRTLGSLKLACMPKESPDLLFNGQPITGFTITNENEVIFDPVLTGEGRVTGSYCCW